MENETYLNDFVDSFINGNLTWCKNECSKFNIIDMRSHFIEYAEFSFQKAQLAVDYLYNDGSFQSYCDCDNSIKHEIRCNNCGTYFENDYDLAQIVDIDDGELINGCPECQTDSYLMDLIEYA